MSNKTRKQIFYTIFIIYGMLSVIYIYMMVTFPERYQQTELENISIIENELIQVLDTATTHKEMEKQLAELVQAHPMELFVKEEDTIIYTTMPQVKTESVHTIVNEQAFSFFEDKYYTENNHIYFVSKGIYQLPMAQKMNEQMMRIFLICSLMLFLLTLALSLLYRMLILPLNAVRETIQKMENNQYENIAGDVMSDDVVTQKLTAVASQINNRFENIFKSYTDLEVALNFERESLTSLMQISRAFIHDLKTPLHQLLLENETTLADNSPSVENEVNRVLATNVHNMDEILTQLNEILGIMDTKMVDMFERYETFNLVKLLEEAVSYFQVFLKHNDLRIYLDVPQTLNIYSNQAILRVIFHNVISNASKYAEKGSEIELSVFEKDDSVHIEVINVTDENHLENLKNQNQVSRFFDQNLSSVQQYGSGNGLYLLNDLTKFIDGTYELIIVENHAHVKIILPLVITEK